MRKEGKREREREGKWASGCRRRDFAAVMFHGSCWEGRMWLFLRLGCCLLGGNMKWTRMVNIILL